MEIMVRRGASSSEYYFPTPEGTYDGTTRAALGGVRLFAREGGRQLARVRLRWNWFIPRSEIELPTGRVYQLQREDAPGRVLLATSHWDSYRLYCHEGLSRSVFRGDEQVAALVVETVNAGDGLQTVIRVDRAADIVLVLCLLLAETEEDDITVMYFGHEARPFDPLWVPK